MILHQAMIQKMLTNKHAIVKNQGVYYYIALVLHQIVFVVQNVSVSTVKTIILRTTNESENKLLKRHYHEIKVLFSQKSCNLSNLNKTRMYSMLLDVLARIQIAKMAIVYAFNLELAAVIIADVTTAKIQKTAILKRK